MRLELGDIAKDTITGFTGVVIARTVYQTNEDRYTVQPQGVKDGKPLPAYSFDHDRLQFVKKSKVSTIPPAPPTCGLGDEVKDPLSGLKGVVTQVTTWNEGCTIVAIQPKELKDGAPVDSYHCDDRKLVVVKAAKPEPEKTKTGGPRPEPRRSHT